MAAFDIVLRTRASLATDVEPSEFVSEYEGLILCEDEETGVVTKVGRVAALRVNAALAHNSGESLFDVCDCHSQELHDLHQMLYEPGTYSFREELVRRYEVIHADLLLIDYVVLNPRWRKLKLGLLAVRKLVDLLGGGVGLAVSEIAPLRAKAHKQLRVPSDWIPQNATKDERKVATVHLRRYFRRMGFRRLGHTPYYALSMTQITPNATELLGPNDEGS